jgi:hypothetical protein
MKYLLHHGWCAFWGGKIFALDGVQFLAEKTRLRARATGNVLVSRGFVCLTTSGMDNAEEHRVR